MAGSSPVIVPYGADRTLYIVVDSLATRGPDTPEVQLERSDFDTIVNEFMAGLYRDPLRVVAFNTLEHWSKDLSSEIAAEIQNRCDMESMPVPDHVRDFLERHGGAITGRGR